ncbi:MAG TPA: uridine kinase [Cellulomonadaceae bacterium]|nr:uridine kinase [Cellulomonadaceae bacterium]
MHVRPLTPAGVVDHLVRLVVARPEGRVRVLVDGHPSTHPEALADALVDPLRAVGRPVVRVSAADFLRPASVRFEHGRTDDSALDDRVDLRALAREVLDPWGPGGTGRYLPTLWDPRTDRATRAPYRAVPERGVLVLDGSLLLGRWLELDLTVHLSLRPGTLDRRTEPAEEWTLGAYRRYAADVVPEQTADVVVRVDDARRPALVERP